MQDKCNNCGRQSKVVDMAECPFCTPYSDPHQPTLNEIRLKIETVAREKSVILNSEGYVNTPVLFEVTELLNLLFGDPTKLH